jgi:hypothetical protein
LPISSVAAGIRSRSGEPLVRYATPAPREVDGYVTERDLRFAVGAAGAAAQQRAHASQELGNAERFPK